MNKTQPKPDRPQASRSGKLPLHFGNQKRAKRQEH